jgi:hypothetical protein
MRRHGFILLLDALYLSLAWLLSAIDRGKIDLSESSLAPRLPYCFHFVLRDPTAGGMRHSHSSYQGKQENNPWEKGTRKKGKKKKNLTGQDGKAKASGFCLVGVLADSVTGIE